MFRAGTSIALGIKLYDGTARLELEHEVTSVVDVALLPQAIGGNKQIEGITSMGEDDDFLEECQTGIISIGDENKFGAEYPTISKFVQELKFVEVHSQSQS